VGITLNLNTLIGFLTLILIVFLLSAYGGYQYAKMTTGVEYIEDTDTLILPIIVPNDTIHEYHSTTKIVSENFEDSTKINLLVDSISGLYAKLESLKVKQIAILDTIFPKSNDTLYLEFDKVTDVFSPIYLRRSVYEIPIEQKILYIPCDKHHHSFWVDIGIGSGAFGIGYLIGNIK
jgi:hypothetical protein